MFITRTFSDMKMGKKLGLSFVVLIVATLTIALLAFKGFETIKENAQKQDITVDFVNTLGEARTSRLLYQYTKDEHYAQVNAKALNDLTAQVNRLKTFSWDSQGENTLTTAANELENYKTHREVFYNASQKRLLPPPSFKTMICWLSVSGLMVSRFPLSLRPCFRCCA